MTTSIRTLMTAVAAFAVALAGAAEVSRDHFAATDRMVHEGGACTFADEIGTVFQSDWQTRHWVKIDGKITEFNGEVNMSDPGWFQTFEAGDLSVIMRLRRTGDRGDGVPMVGEIVVTWQGKPRTFTVSGGCGA